MQLAQNLGGVDRIIRAGLGALVVVGALTGRLGLWGWVGLILLATAGMRFCPIYRVLGLKTCTDC